MPPSLPPQALAARDCPSRALDMETPADKALRLIDRILAGDQVGVRGRAGRYERVQGGM